jgi:hypothetical protein
VVSHLLGVRLRLIKGDRDPGVEPRGGTHVFLASSRGGCNWP